MNKRLLGIYFCLIGLISFGQQNLTLDLQQAITLAQEKSLGIKIAKNRYLNSYWRYNVYKKSRLPSFYLNSSLPVFNRSIERSTFDDGSTGFIDQNWLYSAGNIGISQDIPFTGGDISLNTSLSRTDNFGNFEMTNFNSSPLFAQYTQPIFGVNRFKWDKKTEPLAFEAAQKLSQEDLENIAQQTVDNFFNYLIALNDLKAIQTNVSNVDTLYRISKGRYQLGKIAENDLLQMELSVLNSKLGLSSAEINVEVARSRLATFLGLEKNTQITITEKHETPSFTVDVSKAVNEALLNQSNVFDSKGALIEAERRLAEAKKENYNLDLRASFGLSGIDSTVQGAYSSATDVERLSLNLSLPIFDWGQNKANVKRFRANYEMQQAITDQRIIEIEQDVALKAMSFNLMNSQVELAKRAYEVAQKRFDITKQRYYIGKTDITEINNALREKDNARKNYLKTLKNYWASYYELRKITHYDFENGKKLEDAGFDVQ